MRGTIIIEKMVFWNSFSSRLFYRLTLDDIKRNCLLMLTVLKMFCFENRGIAAKLLMTTFA
jgi:hypothetical protein